MPVTHLLPEMTSSVLSQSEVMAFVCVEIVTQSKGRSTLEREIGDPINVI